jgi:hypothetical protein
MEISPLEKTHKLGPLLRVQQEIQDSIPVKVKARVGVMHMRSAYIRVHVLK